jgi:predicted MFS family arabinose efflux permease
MDRSVRWRTVPGLDPMYGPAFLTTVSYMIEAAPEAPEFANSLQASFGNLGVSVRTAAGGWFIASSGIENLPWVGAVFGVLALTMMICREVLDRKPRANTRSGADRAVSIKFLPAMNPPLQ